MSLLYVEAFPEMTMMIAFSPPCAFDGVIKTNDKNNEKHAAAIKTFFASKLSLHQPFYRKHTLFIRISLKSEVGSDAKSSEDDQNLDSSCFDSGLGRWVFLISLRKRAGRESSSTGNRGVVDSKRSPRRS